MIFRKVDGVSVSFFPEKYVVCLDKFLFSIYIEIQKVPCNMMVRADKVTFLFDVRFLNQP
jgi:hypothetical protein